jgi:hypothetical protein
MRNAAPSHRGYFDRPAASRARRDRDDPVYRRD